MQKTEPLLRGSTTIQKRWIHKGASVHRLPGIVSGLAIPKGNSFRSKGLLVGDKIRRRPATVRT